MVKIVEDINYELLNLILNDINLGSSHISHSNYNVEVSEFVSVLHFAQENCLIEGAKFAHKKNIPFIVFLDNARITERGVSYLNTI